jgi:hypothetical protein
MGSEAEQEDWLSPRSPSKLVENKKGCRSRQPFHCQTAVREAGPPMPRIRRGPRPRRGSRAGDRRDRAMVFSLSSICCRRFSCSRRALSIGPTDRRRIAWFLAMDRLQTDQSLILNPFDLLARCALKQSGVLADRPNGGHGRHVMHRLAAFVALRWIGIHGAPFLGRERDRSLSHRRLVCVVGDQSQANSLCLVPDRSSGERQNRPLRTTKTSQLTSKPARTQAALLCLARHPRE